MNPALSLNTFSIVGCDLAHSAWGVAVASKFLAAGALVSWARAGAGSVATQALARVSFGPQGLDLLGSGLSAQETLDRLLAGDDPAQREHRQVACVDSAGRAAAFTGTQCMTWAGHRIGHGYACQGNILTGPETIDAMAAAFETTPGELGTRLVAALAAGDAAGGDRRGKQSAAVLVVMPGGGYGGDNDRYLDLRVDDHPQPVARLQELLVLHALYFGKSDPADRLPITPAIATELQTVLARLGYWQGTPDGVWDQRAIDAFFAFVNTENLEERWTPDDAHRLDPVILQFIRERF